MKHPQFALNMAKTQCWGGKCNICHLKKLTFNFLAQNMRTYESWWFNIPSSSVFPVKKF
jgi:hypothetical protein